MAVCPLAACPLVIVGVGHESPAGPGEQRFGLAGLERGPGRLAERGHRGLEAGTVGIAGRPGHGHADGQAAPGRGHLPELPEDVLQDGRLQVDGDTLEQEQAGRLRVEPGRAQPVSHRVAGEVGLDEPDVGRGDAEPLEPPELVALGRGVVDLEPADTRLGVPERAAVVTGRADHDLPHAPIERADDGPVEERGARGEVVTHPVRRGGPPGRDVGGQGLVGGGITVAGSDPGEAEPVGRDPAGGYRRAAVFHGSSLCHGAYPVGPYRASDQWVVWTASAAVLTSWATSSGWETIATWPAGTSTVLAPMRLANCRSASGGIAWSFSATRNQDG